MTGGTVWHMCDDHEHSTTATSSAPRAAEGPAIDPVTLPEADEVAVTVMVDNTFDALLAPAAGVARAPRDAGRVAARQFADGATMAGLRAEHGFSALVTVRTGNMSSTLLFDTGASPDALAVNAERLGVDTGALQGVVLSHGHFDHAGGFDGLAPAPRPVGTAADRSSRGLDPQAPGAAGRPGAGAAHPVQGRAGARRFRGDRTEAAVSAGRRCPDYRRGGPGHRIRARHAAAAPGLGRAGLES